MDSSVTPIGHVRGGRVLAVDDDRGTERAAGELMKDYRLARFARMACRPDSPRDLAICLRRARESEGTSDRDRDR